MRKNLPTAILSMLMALTPVFTSCGNDDMTDSDGESGSVLEVRTEPYHERESSADDVRSYMALYMTRYHLTAGTVTADDTQLAYKTGQGDEGILYNFSSPDGTLHSVISTELTVNSRVVPAYLKEHYPLVSASDESPLQYRFTTADKSVAITTMKVSDTYFNVNYSLVY